MRAPGADELAQLCESARRIIVADALGALGQDAGPMVVAARVVLALCEHLLSPDLLDHHDHLQDHADPPYIWDL